MLIRFILENFSSFASQNEFSLIAGRQRIHPEHIVPVPNNDFRILRTGVLYGANASGKSNLVRAMAFAQQLVVLGTQVNDRIPVRQFLLDKKLKNGISLLQFTFLCNEKCFTFGFKVTTRQIQEEWLYEVVNGNEKLIFERFTDEEGNAKLKFNTELTAAADDKSFFELIARGTRANQLFLTEAVQRNVKQFTPVWEWFSKQLTIIFPGTRPKGIEFTIRDQQEIAPVFMNLLRAFDTGIVAIDSQEFLLDDNNNDLPDEVREDLERMIPDEKTNAYINFSGKLHYAVRRNDQGSLVALKLQAQHKMRDSDDKIRFDFSEESDGTQRIVDLLPAMTSLLSSNKVVIVDEIDRSLHPYVTYALFDLFLRESKQTGSQLIATTHAENLLTFKLLRKDEIWFVDKNIEGESRLFSLEEFNPRYDKDIMNSYMNGRFGAVPSIVRIKNPFTDVE